MIVKQYELKHSLGDPRRDAGHLAEKQMAHYLHRAFSQHQELYVLNDLRIVDPNQQGFAEEDACQIDHLVLHRFGMFIIESKSCTGVVRIRDDGTGGDEWEFPTGRGSEGRGSPLSQARRQADYLRAFIQSHRESLLGTVPTGLKTLAKMLKGTDQRGVRNMPMQAIVAISERGRLDRTTWKPRTTPFADYVCKADQVVDKVNIEFARHKKVMSLLGKSDGQYGTWIMKAEEVEAIANFLSDQHSPIIHGPKLESLVAPARQSASPAVTSASTEVGCKVCASHSLVAMYGKYGYYWKCSDCGTNTAMPRICTLCAEDGAKTKKVRIRKDGPKYYRTCENCSIEECIWTERAG